MMNKLSHKIKNIICIFVIFLLPTVALPQSAGLLLNGVQQFFDNDGNPLSSGTVTTYYAGTTNLKLTWQDANEGVQNTNPIVLDAAGRAIIYGQGTYRQVVKDSLGNLIWDAATAPGNVNGGSSLTGDGDLVGTVKPWAGIIAPNQYAFTYGQELNRTTYLALFTAITQTINVSCSSGSNTISVGDTSQIGTGNIPIEVICIPTGTVVIAKTGSTITVSNPATITVNATATFFPWGNGNGSTTFNIPDYRGSVLAGRNNMGGIAGIRLTQPNFGPDPNATGAIGGDQNRTISIAQLPIFTPNVSSVSTATPIITSKVRTGVTLAGAGSTDVAVDPPQDTGITTAIDTQDSHTHTVTIDPIGGGEFVSIIQPTITTNFIIKITPDTNSAIATGVTSINGMIGDIACGSSLLCTGNVISVNPTLTTLPNNSVALGTGTPSLAPALAAGYGSVVTGNGVGGSETAPTFQSRNTDLWPVNFIVNGDFTQWTTCPTYTCTPVSNTAGFIHDQTPDNWYGGSGAGGTLTYSLNNFTNGQTDVPGYPPFFSRYAWSVQPTDGSNTEYTATCGGLTHCRNTYLEQDGNEIPNRLTGKVATYSGWFRTSTGTTPIAPVIFVSSGIISWLAGQDRSVTAPGGIVYTTNTAVNGEFYVYQVTSGSGATGLPVVAIADNGSGLCRLQFANTTAFPTSSVMTVGGISGVTGCNGSFVVTHIDATHVDLQASTFGGSGYPGGAYGGIAPNQATIGATQSDGNLTWTALGHAKGRVYDIYEGNTLAAAGNVSSTTYLGPPHTGAVCTVTTSWTPCAVTIAVAPEAFSNSTDYAGSGDSPRALLPFTDTTPYGGTTPYIGFGFDIIGQTGTINLDFTLLKVELGQYATPFIAEPRRLNTVGTLDFIDRLGYTFGTGSPTTGLIAQTALAPSTFARRTITGSSPIIVTNGDGSGGDPTISCSTCVSSTGAALTKTDDTNVTLTLGGTPTTALLQATSITAGWTGRLAYSRFTQGATNTVLANSTSGLADFAAFAMPSCSDTSGNHLNWLTNTGFVCGTSTSGITALTGNVTASGTGSVAATLVNIPTAVTAAGTIVFTNTAAPSSPSSAHVSIFADSTDLRFHDKNASGTIGTTVVSDTGASNNFLTGISAAGVITKAQPSFSNLSGSIASGQMPALTGDVTMTAGTTVTTLANIPTATPAVGTILYTNIAAPSSPASGKVSVYSDSTDLRFHDKNASGVIGTTVVADTGASNNFITAISAAGVITKAQPSAANLSNGTTGTGGTAVVLATSPTLVTPTIGVATATSVNKVTITAPATGSTLAIADGLTLTYAEGTWTPVLTFGTPGNLSVSYTSQVGTYTKVGRLVTLNFNIVTSAFTFTTASGALEITGQPFTAQTTSSMFYDGSLQWSGITKVTYTQIVARVAFPSPTLIDFFASGSGVTSSQVVATDTPTAGTIILRGTITFEAI